VLADNHIHHVGLSYPSAIALWTGGQGGPGNLVLHNEVHDTPYSGICCSGEDHRIEGNRVYRCMQQLRDGAGIYITFCKRIVVRGNVVRDIFYDGTNLANAYYLDEQAEDCVVEGNLAQGCGSPLLAHWNRNNLLRNNIFVADADACLRFPRSSGWVLERNVIAVGGALLLQDWQAVVRCEGNLLYSAVGKIETAVRTEKGEYRREALQASPGCQIGDPRLQADPRGRVSFAPQSPAGALGIKPLDLRNAGPRLGLPPAP
jgi:hypothetical protein